jgi:hypothetical protein
MVLRQAKRNINVKRNLKRTLKPIGKLKIFCFHAKNSVLFNFCQKSGGGKKMVTLPPPTPLNAFFFWTNFIFWNEKGLQMV